MKLIKLFVVMTGLLIIFSGCSEYQLSSRKQNVSVENIAPRSFTVNFCGNAYMSQKEVEKYALQRASEVTLSKGYSYFAVLKKDDKSQICQLNFGGRGGQAPSSGAADTSYDFQPFKKPNVTLTIQCFAKEEKMPEGSIDAEEFLKQNFPGLKK